MTTSKSELIQALHASPIRCVLALTGGGTQAAADLLNVPGASRTVLEVAVPYSEDALADYLGRPPEQYCSAATSRAMAARAYQRAAWLAPRQAVRGVAVTASLATDRPNRGEHRFFITIHGATSGIDASLVLAKGARDRAGEEAILDGVLLNVLAEACGIAPRLPIPLRPEESLKVESFATPGSLPSFLRGERERLCLQVHGQVGDAPAPAALLPGSFNPLHAGHCQLADAAGRLLGKTVDFEISVVNADKPALSAEEIVYRTAQFAWRANLWLDRAPTFPAKAALFPGTVFVVGVDTAVRILEPKYYGGGPEATRQALETIRRHGCRFLVGGRLDAGGRFVQLEDTGVPAEFRALFQGIPEDVFRCDLSSTSLRGG